LGDVLGGAAIRIPGGPHKKIGQTRSSSPHALLLKYLGVYESLRIVYLSGWHRGSFRS
jgi:hypothetical protein